MADISGHSTTKILLVDDHIIFRDGLKALINTMDHFQVVAEGDNGEVALALLEATEVDLLITDIHMPVMNGMSLISEVRSKYPDLRIIVLTMDSERYFIDKILDLGANGYVTKATDADSLKKVMETVMSGINQFMVVMSEHEMQNARNNNNSKLEQLTKREREVLELIAQGLTDKEIAAKIFLSAYTVTTHRKNLLSKLGLNNKVELARFALQNRIGSEKN